jgi:hypothetical protein
LTICIQYRFKNLIYSKEMKQEVRVLRCSRTRRKLASPGGEARLGTKGPAVR